MSASVSSMSVSSFSIRKHPVVKDFDYMIKLIVVGSAGMYVLYVMHYIRYFYYDDNNYN